MKAVDCLRVHKKGQEFWLDHNIWWHVCVLLEIICRQQIQCDSMWWSFFFLIWLKTLREKDKMCGVFLAHLSMECSVSYCDHSPSVHNLLVNALASTNIKQSSPNLVKMYMTTRARMSSITELIRPELSELSALESENLPYLTMFIL